MVSTSENVIGPLQCAWHALAIFSLGVLRVTLLDRLEHAYG
jgi:hypothetical protein